MIKDITAQDIERLNTITPKYALARFVELFKAQAEVTEEIKAFGEDCKEQGLYVAEIKAWAKKVADGKEVEHCEKLKKLLDVADQMELFEATL